MYELHKSNELLLAVSLLGNDEMVFILVYASGAEEQ